MKLLNRSIQLYLAYSFIVILVAIPIFYFAIGHIIREESDESLMAQKPEVIQHFSHIPTRVFDRGMTEGNILVVPGAAIARKDSFYTSTEYDTISKEEIPYRILVSDFAVNNQHYSLFLRHSLVDNADLIQSILLVAVMLIVLIITGSLIINSVISKRTWHPFYKTMDQLNRYEMGKSDLPVFKKTSIKEFSDLNQSIASLIDKNLSVFKSQKEFTENASHEMQTPLAVLGGKVELLMQTQPLTIQQATLISEIADASHRMNRLNRALLLLSKIENNQFAEKEKLQLKDVLHKIIDLHQIAAEQKNCKIELDDHTDNFVDANRSLMEIMVSNLLMNAIRYSPPATTINIYSRGNECVVSNNALDGALDDARIFDRFYKSGADSGSTGLGLSIIYKICQLYGYQVRYGYKDNRHSFIVQFI